MTEKRFTPSGRWIKDNYIDKLLNIDFNTITDRNLCCDLLNQLEDEKKMNGKIATKYFEENEQLKKEKEFWKGDSCKSSNYLSILSMDCQIVEEALLDLKNVIDVDTEAYNLLDELSDKFDDLQQHRLNWGIKL